MSFLPKPSAHILYWRRGKSLYVVTWVHTKVVFSIGTAEVFSIGTAKVVLSKHSAALLADVIEQMMREAKLSEPVDSLGGATRRIDDNLRGVFG